MFGAGRAAEGDAGDGGGDVGGFEVGVGVHPVDSVGEGAMLVVARKEEGT